MKKNKSPRKRKKEFKSVELRIPFSLLAALDKQIARANKVSVGTISRNAYLNYIVKSFLERVEDE